MNSDTWVENSGGEGLDFLEWNSWNSWNSFVTNSWSVIVGFFGTNETRWVVILKGRKEGREGKKGRREEVFGAASPLTTNYYKITTNSLPFPYGQRVPVTTNYYK